MIHKILDRLLPKKFTISLRKGFNQNYYKLHAYSSVSDYISTQIAKTSDKLARGWTGAWTTEETISKIVDYLIKQENLGTKGICHGVRTGFEVTWFNKCLDSSTVIGTDVDPVAAKNENVTLWDFQEKNNDWTGKFDFVYSNSHDHASDPETALRVWAEQLKPNGLIFLEHSRGHGTAYQTDIDCWGVEPELLPFSILRFKNANVFVKDLIIINEEQAHAIFVLGKKNS